MSDFQIIYIVIINYLGLLSKEPIQCTLESKNTWVNKDENIIIKKLGTQYKNGYVIFSSPVLSDAKLWLDGAKAVMRQIQLFSRENIGCISCNNDKEEKSDSCIFCEANKQEMNICCKVCKNRDCICDNI